MAVGDILKEALLVVDTFSVKTGETIELGEVVYNDGSGILAAPSTVTGPFYVALAASVSAVPATIECLISGKVNVQKATGTAIKKGQYVMISGTAGELALCDDALVGNGGAAAYFTTTISIPLKKSQRRCGMAAEDVASGDTDVDVWFGVK